MQEEGSHSGDKGFGPVASYIDLGLRFALSIAIGTGGGYWLDSKLHTLPLFLVIGLFIGATSGFVTIYRVVYSSKNTKENNSE